MKKKVKIILFSIVCFLVLSVIIINRLDIFKEDIYVVSKNNSPNKKTDKIDQVVKNEGNKSSKDESKIDTNIQNNKITIYISGAINRPGIVTIESDKRLYDAVELLGGATKEADLNGINLSLKLEDEQHYIIPKIGETISVTSNNDYNKSSLKSEPKNESESENNKNPSNESKININTATLEELDTLPGIGEATANKILQHREENGKFASIEDIKNVNGIGDKKYENLKDLIYTD